MSGDNTRFSERSAGIPLAHVGNRDVQWANAYLASLAVGPSRSTTASALRVVAKDFFGCEPDEMPWTALRAAEVGWLRAELAERRAPATAVNLAGLRRFSRTSVIGDKPMHYNKGLDLGL